MPKSFPIRINREGLPFIALFGGASVLLGYLAPPLGWAGLVLTAWCVWFFRDPDRDPPARRGVILSPADGKIMTVGPAAAPEELGLADAPMTRVSIFMNVFDVHVNRVPADGTVSRVDYRPGRFFNASLDKASEHNERQSIRLETAEGLDLAVVQIAGLIARRIKCTLVPGQEVKAGERFGIIRFGSRLDVYLPDHVPVLVKAGETAIAGETVIADTLANAPAPDEGGGTR
ncbi:MAG: phosphatidylserine decarboxylase [Proteobacteria bacterium]|nr:phosphatidylserine decarboxylase [Pseudomonadota bacterium]